MKARTSGTAVVAVLVAVGAVAAAQAHPPLRTAHAKAPLRAAALHHGAYLAVSQLASPPAWARAGATVRLGGLVSNSGDRAARGPVTVRLVRPGVAPRVVGRTSVRVAARTVGGYRVSVRLPRNLTTGSYALVACSSRYGTSGPLQCATARERVRAGAARARPQAASMFSVADCSSGAHSLSKFGDRVYPQMGNGGYVSVHTDVTLNYDTAANLFLPGTHVDLTQRATQCLTDLSLDFEPTSLNTLSGPNMTVNSVAVNGQPATFVFLQPTYPGDPNGQNDPDPAAHAIGTTTPVSATNPNPPACSPTVSGTAQNGGQCPATKLVITPSIPIPSGATYVVTVNYTGRPGVHNDGDGTTEGWFRNGTSGAFVTTEPVGTMAWMPINNHPSAKPTYDFYDTTNVGKTAIGNGELVGFTDNAPDANFPGGSRTWHWHSPEPIANYLVENSIDSFDMSQRIGANGIVYTEAQGSTIMDSRKATNKAVMDQQEDITSFQSQFNGPFPFTTNGVIVGVPSASFEEEMQTKITFAGGSISLGTFNHENMHQWFGDNVSESSFNETFWKEGFARLGEYLNNARTAQRNAGGAGTPAGDAAFRTSLVNQFNTTYNSTNSTFWTVAPSNPTVGNLFTTANTYTRPATAYLALWQILGQNGMVGVMKHIQQAYGGGSISEPQLKSEFQSALANQSAECHAKLDNFLTQWFDVAWPSGAGVNKPQITGPGLAGPGFFCAGLDYTGPTSVVYGTPTTLSTVLTDQNDAPLANQTVTFMFDGTSVTATTDQDGAASVSPGTLAPGSHTVVVTFDGASTYGFTMARATVVVAKADQSITFDPLPDVTFGALDFDVGATSSAGLPVSFAASGSCTVAGTKVHVTGGGSCTITASQGGDDNYNAAPDVARTFAVARATQTISFAAIGDQTFGDADFGIDVSASSGLTVGLAVTSGPCTLDSATSPAHVHLAGAGVCVITASQPGDANYLAAADVPRSFTIGKASQTITFAALADRTFGDADFAVSASASSNLAVTFAASGACSLTGASVHITAAGSCTITASQAGDADFNPAPDVARSFAIGKAAQTITFAALADRTFGGDFPVSATASSGLPVSFVAGPAGVCTLAGATVHMVGVGDCTVTASQSGSSNYQAAPQVARTFAIANSSTGRATGKSLKPRTGGEASFDVQASRRGLSGDLDYVGQPPRHGKPLKLHAKQITAFGISADGTAVWIAGVAKDGRTFRVYAEDNGDGRRGNGDVFRLWIGDVLQTGDGSMTAGAVRIRT